MRPSLLRLSRFALVLVAAAVLCPPTLIVLHAQTAAGHAQANRVADEADLSAKVALHHTVPGWAVSARDAGPMDEASPITVTVVVARDPAAQAAFDQLLADQQNPNSPRYHQWLTPEQMGQQFGPTQHDLDALTGWLSSQGLTVTEVSPSRVLVKATAASAVVAKAFGTAFRMFTLNGKPQYSLTSEPTIPAALAPVVAAIAGLSQVELRPMSRVQAAPARTTGMSSEATPEYTDSGTHYMFAGDFATIFDINPLYSAGIKGAGQHVAIIGQTAIAATDISEYATLSNLGSSYTLNVIVPTNGMTPGKTADEGESDLDLQRVIGVAPAVTADFVTAASVGNNQGIDVSINWEVNSLKDPVMTISYGACEANAGSANTMAWDSLMGTAAGEGISVFVSSADSGAATCDTAFTSAPATQVLSINYLCASSHVTCVGGTEFNDTASPGTYWSATNSTGNESALGYIPEGAWNESTANQVAASGGGVSTVIAKPAFQAGIGVPADGFRDAPDVAFPAAAHDGYFGCQADATFSNGGTGDCAANGGVVFSGTSAAAPGWAGVAALVNEKLGGSGQGNLNPLIYRLANLTTGSPFHDATPTTAGVSPCVLTTPSLCNNSTPGPATLTGGLAGYALTTGYDQVTGWGSIDVYSFVTQAAGQVTLAATATTLTAAPSATTITTGQTVAFTATVTATSGTPTGSVQFSQNGVALGSPVTLASGVATLSQTFSAIGTYQISAVYQGSGTYADSASQTLTLNVTAAGKTASTTALTATATTATPTTAVGFTATVAGSGGTPTGTVQFKLNGQNLGTAVSVSGGTASLPAQALALGTDVVTAVYSGDNTFSGSTSSAVTVTVNALTSSTSIAESATATSATGYLVFSGTVTGSNGGPVPTGTLTLYSGGSPVLSSIPLTNGSLAVAVSGAPVGSYAVYWVYSGDSNYSPSQSSPIDFTVSSSFVPTYTLTAKNASVSAAVATAATNTITLASANGYTSAVTLSCTASYTGSSTDTVVEPTCSFSPASINLGADLASHSSNVNVNAASVYETSTVTLTTVTPHDIKRASTESPRTLRAFGGTALAGLLLFALPGVRRKRMWNALAGLLLLTAIAGASGCGSSSTPTGGGGGLTGTPSGAYTITVSGTGGVSTTFTLNVQ